MSEANPGLYSGPTPRLPPIQSEPGAIRTMSILNGSGDTVIGWTQDNDEWVIPMIQKKMDEGYTFWIVRRQPGLLRRTDEIVLRNPASNALPGREVIMKDDVARILLEQGRIGIVAQPAAGERPEQVIERRAETAREAAGADTVAHRPLRGG